MNYWPWICENISILIRMKQLRLCISWVLLVFECMRSSNYLFYCLELTTRHQGQSSCCLRPAKTSVLVWTWWISKPLFCRAVAWSTSETAVCLQSSQSSGNGFKRSLFLSNIWPFLVWDWRHYEVIHFKLLWSRKCSIFWTTCFIAFINISPVSVPWRAVYLARHPKDS